MNYVYILKCRDGTLYTGYTNNLGKRLKAHNSEKGAKYTKGRTPVRLVYFEKALHREYIIKKMKRKKKLELINPVKSRMHRE